MHGDDEYYRARERHMVEAMAEGYTIQEIAKVYRLSPRRTQEVIIERLGKDAIQELLRSRQEALRAANDEQAARLKEEQENYEFEYDFR